jgi:hypothetical protein
MDMGFGQEWGDFCLKRKFRWLFTIPDVSADGIGTLPPSRGARPSISFREIEIQHYNEMIYFPGKPEWKTIPLVLFDVPTNGIHPVLKWIAAAYDPQTGLWTPSFNDGFREEMAILELYDGCGNVIECWQFDGLWPQAADFGELDMGSTEIVTCDVTLRYDRAYSMDQCGGGQSMSEAPSSMLGMSLGQQMLGMTLGPNQ